MPKAKAAGLRLRLNLLQERLQNRVREGGEELHENVVVKILVNDEFEHYGFRLIQPVFPNVPKFAHEVLRLQFEILIRFQLARHRFRLPAVADIFRLLRGG